MKNIFGTIVLLIFIGLSVPANVSAAEYEFETVLPSEQTLDNGMFSGQGDMFASPMRAPGWGDPGDDDDPNGGGGDDCEDCFNDSNQVPVGNGIYVLMLMVVVYGGMLFYRRRKESTV